MIWRPISSVNSCMVLGDLHIERSSTKKLSRLFIPIETVYSYRKKASECLSVVGNMCIRV